LYKLDELKKLLSGLQFYVAEEEQPVSCRERIEIVVDLKVFFGCQKFDQGFQVQSLSLGGLKVNDVLPDRRYVLGTGQVQTENKDDPKGQSEDERAVIHSGRPRRSAFINDAARIGARSYDGIPQKRQAGDLLAIVKKQPMAPESGMDSKKTFSSTLAERTRRFPSLTPGVRRQE
jgi:hypothetical protein